MGAGDLVLVTLGLRPKICIESFCQGQMQKMVEKKPWLLGKGCFAHKR